MIHSIVSYLEWVFPVQITNNGDHVIYEGQKYTSERDLIVVLYSNFLSLPKSYYADRGFDRAWEIVNCISGDELMLVELGYEIAGLAWKLGFINKLEKILIAHDDAAPEYYWCLSRGSDPAILNFACKYIHRAFKDMVYGGSMKSLIQSFHDKKREEFMRRFRLINPQQAEILDECLSESEVEKFLKRDAEFMPVLRQRLMDKGHGAAIDHLTGGDLGL